MTKTARYDFKAGDEVVVRWWMCIIIFPLPTWKQDRVSSVDGDSVLLEGGGRFDRKTGREIGVKRGQTPRWIEPVTDEMRRMWAGNKAIQRLQETKWNELPDDVVLRAADLLPKPPTSTVKDLQHWLDDGTVVDNGNGTVTMGVDDFKRLVIEPAAGKEAAR